MSYISCTFSNSVSSFTVKDLLQLRKSFAAPAAPEDKFAETADPRMAAWFCATFMLVFTASFMA